MKRSCARRGFTLVELMIVVCIIGILAALAMYGFRRYQQSAGAGEAVAMLQMMKGAEETYRAEFLTYGGCTDANPAPQPLTGPGFVATDFFPRQTGTLAAAGGQKVMWGQNTAGANVTACFRAMGFRGNGAVRFTYAARSGTPGPAAIQAATPPNVTIPNPAQTLNIGVPREPWYFLMAVGNRDNDNVFASLVVDSVRGDVVQMFDDTE